MDPYDVTRAIAAATAIATSLDLPATDATVLHNSNKLALHLTPADVFARVAPVGQEVAQFEVELAQRLAEIGSPVAALEPRVDPVVYTRDGFAVTLWTYYEPATPDVVPADFAEALAQLHAGMGKVDMASPRFTDRITEAEKIVGNPALSPELTDADRAFLSDTLGSVRRAIHDRGAAEQLLHGEPHPGNLLSTKNGPLFIDFETCCRGPVEFDLAHVPEAVCEHYPNVDQALLGDCRQLVLAMVAAWRWDIGDQFPNGKLFGDELLRTLREGPPWPTLDAVTSRLDLSQDPQVAEAIAAEQESLSPECRADPARLRRLLAPDFHEYGASGGELEFEGTAELVAANTDLNAEPIRVQNMRGYRLADGLVMLKYTSDNGTRRSHRTSLWRRVATAHWQMFHHQGTPTQQ
ncbi:phosphotransferase [Kribbella sp. NPDC051952]|uniref:phosphotransferase n=1 Tax=Kribbella sp. NPDC051952 TaxID=3154851 RepID=UPI00341FEEE7